MSKIGKQPIEIPPGVHVIFQEGTLSIKGPKGNLQFKPHPRITVNLSEKQIIVQRKSEESSDKSLHGLTRTLIANMIDGVTKGFSKQLEIQGVGYRASVQGKKLELSLGFSHSVQFHIPEEIQCEIDKEKKNIITVSGIDKALVGQVASNIRCLRPPEPYKGKGIRYTGEVVRRKAGKTAAATSGAKAG